MKVGIRFLSFAQDATISSSSKDGERIYEPEKRFSLDNCVLKVQYRMITVRDVNRPEIKKENVMLLQIGEKISKFSDFYMLKADSLGEVLAKQKMRETEVINRISPYYRGFTALNVFKNYPADKITVLDRAFVTGLFKYEEDKEKLRWEMQQGSNIVCGYKCRKATLTFRGRNYTAWYVPEIAFSDGPWKFWGLPGLILKVSDDRNEFVFECIALEKARQNEQIYIKDRGYFITTRERFNKTVKRAYENPRSSMENRGITLGKDAIGNRSLPFNPIELSD